MEGMIDALQKLKEFRESIEAQPWPKPGADLDIVAYGAWLDHAACFWRECGDGVLKKFAAHRRRIEALTVTALNDLRVAVKSHGKESVRALRRQAKQNTSEARKLRADASNTEEGHHAWIEGEAQRKARWADDLNHAQEWSQHQTNAWLSAIDEALAAPLEAPLLAFGLPPGGDEIPECSWHGVFRACQQEYPNNLPPSQFNLTSSGDPKRPNAALTDYGLGAQTLERCDLPRLATPPSYLKALREQGSSPWMAARVVGEVLQGASPSPINEFIDTRPAGSNQLTEWWWYSVMPQIHSWYARHQPQDSRQPVLHLWEKRVQVPKQGQVEHVHPDFLYGHGLSLSDWFACRAEGRTLPSHEAEAIALSVAALLDSLCLHTASLRVRIEPAPGRSGSLVTWSGITEYVRPALAELLSRAATQHQMERCRIADRRALNKLFPGIEDYLPTETGTTGKGVNSHEQATFLSQLVGMVDDFRQLAVGAKSRPHGSIRSQPAK